MIRTVQLNVTVSADPSESDRCPYCYAVDPEPATHLAERCADVVAIAGRRELHEPPYDPADWHERDNFPTLDHARAYARYMARRHPPTPYRIVRRDERFAVEFVPEWLLR